jgi:hypothetical protein
MIYVHTKFDMSVSNGSLVVAIKPKAKYRFHTLAISSLNTLIKSVIIKRHAHLIISCFRHVVITDCKKLNSNLQNLKIYDGGILKQLLTGLCLRLQVGFYLKTQKRIQSHKRI